MIELVFIACLATAPDHCETKALQFAENISPGRCLMGAQPRLAEWTNTHPNWRVKRWKCRTLNFAERDA